VPVKIVDYVRFAEIQQRRARVREELRQSPDPAPPKTTACGSIDDRDSSKNETRRLFHGIVGGHGTRSLRGKARDIDPPIADGKPEPD